MNLTKKNKLLIYIICIVAVISMVACVIGNVFNDKVEIDNATGIANVALNSNYSAFANGSTYTYTDLNKVEAAHNGTINDDTSVIKVDRNQEHGTINNPYVIDNVTQWNYFATNSSSGAADETKVFVLGQDLDFSGMTFNAVANFSGKFYGGGHTLKNITKDFGSQNECGVYCVIGSNAILADINLDNVSISSAGGRIGALVGSTNGGDILNCHVKGRVSGVSSYSGAGSQTLTVTYPVGGLVGHATGQNVNVIIYRSSANVDINNRAAQNGVSSGGILGGFSCSNGTLNSSIYDCLAIIKITTENSGNDSWFGGITNYIANLGEQAIENCVAYISATDNAVRRISFGSLFNSWGLPTKNITIKNVFSDGILNVRGDANT